MKNRILVIALVAFVACFLLVSLFFMEPVFWVCVQLMVVSSKAIGISYQQLNVILFVILHPALTAWLFWRYRVYKQRYTQLSSPSGQL
jgi:hypothetical protein